MKNQSFYDKRKNGTETSAFGTSGRINHDASKFYNSKLYEGLNNGKDVEYVENPIDSQNINKVFCKSSEYILIFCKDTFTRRNPHQRKSTISKEEFLEFTRSVWKFSAERASRVGHPAPFPVELPYRVIQLYTFENEIVLDPFAGSGTACLAALKTNRKYVAYDIDKKYCDLAEQRIKQFSQEQITLLQN
ncbi:MAG: site-specific DNA-methyltransferase [Patescibacteria group bacterium]|nr:site-specific DNA-methyltransferase [Patescibacteria group bacterium]